MKDGKLELYFFFAAFIAILLLIFALFLPFLGSLAFSVVLAVIFYPVYQWLVARLRIRGLAAFLSVLLILLIVFVPLGFFAFVLLSQAQDLFVSLNQGGGAGNVNAFLHTVEEQVGRLVPGFTFDFNSYLRQGLDWLTQSLGAIFAGTAQVVLSLLIGLVALFYFFRDGEWFRHIFVMYSPLRDTYDNEILVRIRRTINAILKGSVFVAIVQGILSGIGFAIFGLPHAALWGAAAALGALIPGIGTSIVFIPAVLYLFFTASLWQSLGLLLWGILAVGLIDNFLGPFLIGHGVRIHPLFVLLSVLGGLQFFGLAGFLLGPIVFSLLLSLADIYNVLIKRHEAHDHAS